MGWNEMNRKLKEHALVINIHTKGMGKKIKISKLKAKYVFPE
jgi:hypothetical protein